MEERTKNKKETFSLFNLFSAPEKNAKQNDLNGCRYAGIGLALGWHWAGIWLAVPQHDFNTCSAQRVKLNFAKRERRNTRSTSQVDFLSKLLKLKQRRRGTNNPVAKLSNPCRCTVGSCAVRRTSSNNKLVCLAQGD